MSIAVTIRKTDGTVINKSTSAFASRRPGVGDYIEVNIGDLTVLYAKYQIKWVYVDHADAWTIGAALPDDPPPPPPV